MLAYAPTNRAAARAASPRALLLVVAGHAVLLALVLTARGEMPGVTTFVPTDITFIDPVKPPPPPPPPEPTPPRSDVRSVIDTPAVIIPTPLPTPQPLDRGPPVADPTPVAGNAVDPVPLPVPDVPRPIVRKAARFITPADDVRPPYPASKQRMAEEASLRLALQIDERGRVTSVTSVGTADPVFLEAARRHIVKRWRYAPATEGGSAVPSRIVVTLRFELEE